MISMILYHGTWDLVYIFGVPWEWYHSRGAFYWQQSICWTFILLSGFCWPLGRKHLKRGVTVFLCGAAVTVVTLLFMPGDRVIFGVLTLLGSCMLLMIPMSKVLEKCNSHMGLLAAALLFAISYSVNSGYVGFMQWKLWKIPRDCYANLLTTYLGFPMEGFFSTDYFPLFPWLFLFVAGYFLYAIFQKQKWLPHLKGKGESSLSRLGRHSIVIYMLHQPVLYGVLYVVFAAFGG